MPSNKNPNAPVLVASAAMLSALAQVLATPFATANPHLVAVLVVCLSVGTLVAIWRP